MEVGQGEFLAININDICISMMLCIVTSQYVTSLEEQISELEKFSR